MGRPGYRDGQKEYSMEIKTLQSELEELYRLTMVYEFHKATYEQHIESLKEKYALLLQETARACDRSEDAMEAVAGHIPQYVFQELQRETSRRKRDIKALDHKMNMVSFFVPLMGEMPSENAKAVTGRMVEFWNAKMPEYKIGHSDYDGIRGGFRKGVFCYITTAVCESLDKPDDCYELTMLRKYRDEYLMSSESGKEIVEEYYNIAPTIVKRISRQENAGEIYRGIWEDYLNPCIRMIEENRKEECKGRYIEMVRKLEKEYLYS